MGTTYDKDRVRKNVAGKSRKSVFYLYRFSWTPVYIKLKNNFTDSLKNESPYQKLVINIR
jgi:hypothetical protein